jgi:glutamate synthase domain-containing protein 2/glutamate synthase domain-containing protein 1/glutamate synthase domain-containing protein 3
MVRKRTFVDHDACGVGFVAQMGSAGSREVVDCALEALRRLGHRGGVDADGRSGDGAGLLTRIPDKFLRREARGAGIELPPQFAVGMVFFPGEQDQAKRRIEQSAQTRGLQLLGWRRVPIDASIVGPQALRTLPIIEQCFLVPTQAAADLEFNLFALRKEVEAQAPAYFCSLSSRTIIYKGLLTPEQLPAFYPDLADPSFISSFAIFHQRYSTNTRPSWSLAQPFRFVAHNGEINTISANRRWLRARQPSLLGKLNLSQNAQLLEEGVSDSASFDNGFEIFLRRGYEPASAMSCMVPPAWEKDPTLTPDLRNFFESHAHEQEPWDGPAALVFTDGVSVGAKLDRNGLRPLRYTRTSDGLVIVGSEAGIADFPESKIMERQRLGPGEMLLADTANGIFLGPKESFRKSRHFACLPKRGEIGPQTQVLETSAGGSSSVMAALGWSEDQHRFLFRPLVESGQETVWSMGDDAAPALLSDMPRPLWDHCKQRFAQVTNPPIDPLRETHVMSLNVYLDHSTRLASPLVDSAQLRLIQKKLSPVERIDFTFPAADGIEGGKRVLDRLEKRAEAIRAKVGLVLLSDRTVSAHRTALPALLALAAVWKGMVRAGAWDVPLIVETGQVIDTHHIALLVAAGASAVVPYIALQEAARLKIDGVASYRKAIDKGLLKVMARMGISNIASYRNSQLFEVIGLDPDLTERFFEDAGSVLGGKGLDELLADCVKRHAAAFGESSQLADHGLYRFRHHGERHATSPEFVRRMHRYLKSPSAENFKTFTELAEQREPVAIRDLVEIIPGTPIPVQKVESEASLLSRFSTQAMSLGAISPETHRTLAIAMNRLGGRSNTGEGGEDPDVYAGTNEANNRVKQVASARFGVTPEYLAQADELEIKIAQGAKPGEGGQLPASKVTAYIARLRHASPNMSLISPPPHHDIYSIEDLAQLIYDLRAINPRARIGVKLVSSTGVGIIAAGVAKAGANVITISGHDGGTGASPLTSIKNTGLPWEVGLRDTHTALLRCGLRRRVRLRVDGGLKFGRDVVVAALLGADEFGFATAALLAVGCVMARQCHLNTCPVGIATQDEKLRARFAGKPEMVENYFRALAGDVRELLASMGAHSIDEIVGAAERLRPRDQKAARAVEEILQPIETPEQIGCVQEADNALRLAMTRRLDELEPLTWGPRRFSVTTADRTVGAHLSGEILRRRDEFVSADYEFVGTAGQSFGAFLVPGVNLRLIGEANDYAGKGMSGGSIAITAGDEACRRGDVLAGNTLLYGATGGQLYVAGRVGERFAVRNSGALAVVEGAGQHACEYMTAGIAVILGPAGVNLGAGMTGGLTYLLDDFIASHLLNPQSVRAVAIEGREQIWIRRVLHRHFGLTGSPRTADLLRHTEALPFVRIEPVSPACLTAETWEPILKYFPRRLPMTDFSRVPAATSAYRRQRVRLLNH